MTYGELFGREVNQMTIRSHLLIFYYCVSSPLVPEKLNREIQECVRDEKHAGEILPCGDLIMRAKRLADRSIELAAQYEQKTQKSADSTPTEKKWQKQQKQGKEEEKEVDEQGFYEKLLRVQNNCLPYLVKEKLCNKFLDRCEKDMLEVTPNMKRKCRDLEQTALECVGSVFCKREQAKYLKCMESAKHGNACLHEKKQMTMCGETHQALARLVSLEPNPNYKPPAAKSSSSASGSSAPNT